MSLDEDRGQGAASWPVLAVVIAVMALLPACTDQVERAPAVVSTPDPGALIEEHTARLSRDGPYRDPNQTERAHARDAVRLLLANPGDDARLDEAFGGLGYTAAHGGDPATGRPYTMYSMSPTAEPAWGVLLIDRSAPPKVLIEVPHPGFDTNTDKLGVALHRLVPGSVLLVAGAHRAAADGAADVAHNDKSMFHVLATAFAKGGLSQIQLHGFADKNLPDAQIVVSTGAGSVTPLARDVAADLLSAGLVVCKAWAASCGRLEGTTNEQGRAAADLGAQFLHLELGWVIRRDPAQRELVARTIADRLNGR